MTVTRRYSFGKSNLMVHSPRLRPGGHSARPNARSLRHEESGTGYRECKTYLHGSGRALRSRTPELARQELWALLVIYQAGCDSLNWPRHDGLKWLHMDDALMALRSDLARVADTPARLRRLELAPA